MAIFQGRYSWDGTKTDNKEPISWFPGAYDLVIAKLEAGNKNITFLRPYICIYTNTGYGYSVSANPEKFAKRICDDFSLRIDKVLWVERKEPDSEKYEVIIFQEKGQMGETNFYSIEKRKPNLAELQLISQYIIRNKE